MTWNYPHFREEEVACKCGCGFLPSAELMQILEKMREEAGFPFVISSAARCPEHNQKESKTGLSGPHTTGRAVDLLVSGGRALTVIRLGLKHGMTGIGVKQKGWVRDRFIHLDCIQPGDSVPRPWLWSY